MEVPERGTSPCSCAIPQGDTLKGRRCLPAACSAPGRGRVMRTSRNRGGKHMRCSCWCWGLAKFARNLLTPQEFRTRGRRGCDCRRRRARRREWQYAYQVIPESWRKMTIAAASAIWNPGQTNLGVVVA